MSKSKSSIVPILGIAAATTVIAALYMYKQKQAKNEKPEDDLPPNLGTTSAGTGAGEEAAFMTTSKGLLLSSTEDSKTEEPKENGNPLAKMWNNFKDKSDRNLKGEEKPVEEKKTEEQETTEEKKPFWAKIIPPKKEEKEEEVPVVEEQPPTPRRSSIWEALIPQKAQENGIQEATAEDDDEKPKEEEPKKLFGFALGKKAPEESKPTEETKEENKGDVSPTSKRRFLGFELPGSPQKKAQSPTADDMTLTESSEDGEPAFDNPSEKPKFMGWFGKKDEEKDAKPAEEDKASESKETEAKPSNGRNIFGWKQQQPSEAETKKDTDAKEDEKDTAPENGEAAPKKFWENWKSPKAGEEPAVPEGEDKEDKEGKDKKDTEGKAAGNSLKANDDLNRKPRQQSFLQAFVNTEGLN